MTAPHDRSSRLLNGPRSVAVRPTAASAAGIDGATAARPQEKTSPPPCPEGTKQQSPGQATRSPGFRRSPFAALKVRDRVGLTMRPVVPALSPPYRAPHATPMNPGLRKALPRAMLSRPAGAPIQRFRFQSEDGGSGQAKASAPMVSGASTKSSLTTCRSSLRLKISFA